VVVEVEFDGMRRGLKGGHDRRRVARTPGKRQIAGHGFGDLRRARGLCHDRVGHRRQRPEIDRDQFSRIERQRVCLGNNQGDRFAGIAHLGAGQQRLRHKGERLAGLDIGLGRRAQRLQTIRLDLGRGQHRQHAGRGQSGPRVDAFDPRMRVRRAQNHRMRQPGKIEVVEIAASTGQKPPVLAPSRPVADYRSQRRHSLSLRLPRELYRIPPSRHRSTAE
jgi:hypothetical protein